MRNARTPEVARAWGVSAVLGLALAGLPLAGLSSAAHADDVDPTDVGLEREVARATAPPAPETGPEAASPVLLRLRVSEARFVRDLARVDVQLELKNTSTRIVEWNREFPMDPKAEVIACALQRADQVILAARSLTFEDGRRIYDETVRPAPTAPTNPGKDPLLVQREADGRLRVSVFPIGPDESVRVLLSFVTSLADRGSGRRYHDPLWLRPAGDRTLAREATATTLFVQPGTLVLAKADDVLLVQPLSPERLLVQPATATAALTPAVLRFDAPTGVLPALTVPGGGLGTRVAYWHVDPKTILAERGITALPEGATLRFTGRGAATRLVPAEVLASAAPVTMAARHHPQAGPLVYDVELVGAAQPERWTVTHPTEPLAADVELIDAVGAWYRAQLARHVLAWAGAAPETRRAKAVAYAVDLGVVLPGTCALALPAAEQRTLSRPSRRLYRNDGTEIGDPGGDADWTAPPSGSFR